MSFQSAVPIRERDGTVGKLPVSTHADVLGNGVKPSINELVDSALDQHHGYWFHSR